MWVLVAGAASGVVTALAFPPVDFGPAGFVSMAPLAIVFRRSRARHVAAAGAAFGLVFFGILLSWIFLFGVAAFISLISLQTGWVVVVLVAGVAMRERLPERWKVLAFPVAVVAAEYLRAHLPFTGFTWGGIGYTQHNATGVLRLASYTGVWGVSFLVALTGALAGEGIVRLKDRPRTSALIFLVAGGLAFSPYALPAGDPGGAEARIALIQGNQPEDPTQPGSDDLSVLLNHATLSMRLVPPDASLVVWPEGAAGSDPLERADLGTDLTETVRRAGVPFLVGARIEVGDTHFRNRAYFLDSTGTPQGFYDKIRMVPFGEFVPGRSFLAPIFKELEQVPKDGIPGASLTVFQIPEGKFASVICFESTFPDLVADFVRNGARLLVVITDNSSFERSAASRQHLLFSQLRAAENRMWVAHVAVTGISGVVAPDGRVLESTELFEPAVLSPTVRFANGITFYARWGDWLPFLCVLLIGLFLAARLVDRVRVSGRPADNSGATNSEAATEEAHGA